MEGIWLALVSGSPAAVAVLISVWLFLKYLKEERAAWRDIIGKAIENNTAAMRAQTLALESLNLAIDKLEAKKIQ